MTYVAARRQSNAEQKCLWQQVSAFDEGDGGCVTMILTVMLVHNDTAASIIVRGFRDIIINGKM